MRLAIQRLARATAVAAAIVALSGSLATGRPPFATLSDVAFKLSAGFSEVDKVRRRLTEAHAREVLFVAA
jgi:hypothetical protein